LMEFAPVSTTELRSLVVDGSPLTELGGDALKLKAQALKLPSLGDEQQLRLLIGGLLRATGGKVHSGTWSEVRDEAKGLLLLAIRRDGCISASSAEATTVLNKPAVVEKYRRLGNRWTISEESRDPESRAVAVARKELAVDDSLNTTEWLSSLADAIEAPVDERPWWTSTPVLIVLVLTAIFVFGHLLLLVRVLMKVHVADSNVLLYPIAGLSASALVGAVAMGINKLSEPKKRK
jgi:hypothetical protein